MSTIVKLGGKYLEWSTIVDAPVAGPFDLDGLRAHVAAEYGSSGVERLPGRLERVEAKGTSSHRDESAEQTVWLNRAGPGREALTVQQIEAYYVRGEAPALSVFACDAGADDGGKPMAPRPVVAYSPLDAATLYYGATGHETQHFVWKRVGPAPEGAARGPAPVGASP